LNKKIKTIKRILKSYSSVFDDCISPIDFEDIAIDIHNTICTDEPKIPHKEEND